MEKENKFYLTKMITIIATIIILLLGIIFIVNKTINNKKETKFLDSGKIISEKIEFDKLDIVVLKITSLKDLEIENIKEEEFDLEKSVVYKKDGEVRLNLVGKGKYEGLYLCDVNETFDNLKVQKEECKIISNEDDSIKEPTIIESTITLDSNGGNLDITSINVKYNDKYKDLPVPQKEGYTFEGWYINEIKINNGDKITIKTDAIAKAKWIADTYTLTLDSNGGVLSVTQINVTYDGNYTNLPIPKKDGYTFNGWYINDTKINNGDIVKITSNQTAKASWSKKTITIKFDVSGGNTNVKPVSVTYDDKYKDLPVPQKEGYTFDGWYIGDKKINNGDKVVQTENEIAKASWSANEYTINYELNEGTQGTNHPTSATFDKIMTIDNPTREGYSFAGWTITSGLNTATAKHGTTDSTVTSPIENSSTKIMSKYFKNLATNGSVTLTANWTIGVYTLTLDGNGISVKPSSISATYDSTYKDLPNLTRDGYTFNGWYIGSTKINNGDKVTITSNATAKALWRANTYTIELDGNGVNVEPTSINVIYDSTYKNLPNLVREGYTFNGWYIENIQIKNTDTVKVTSNQTAKASWSANTYKITLDGNGITINPEFVSAIYDDIYLGLPTPTREGYTFNGWYIGNTKINNSDKVTITSNAAAKASWSANTYKVTLNTNEGNTSVTQIDVTYDDEYTGLPTPTRDGYTFNGWYINDTKINNGDTVKITSNQTATASWSANTYTISYELNGGSYGTTHPTTATYDSNVTIDNPTKLGYTFNGWIISGYDNTAKHGTSENAITNTIDNTLVISTYFKNLRKTSGTVTLTANWSANEYTISYELNNGSYGSSHPTSAIFDNVVTIDNPTREGYSFAGWTITSGLNTSTAKHGTTDSTVTSPIENTSTKIMSKYFKNLTPSGSVTLSANWSSNTYTLTLDGNGVSISPTSVSATYDSTYKDLPNLTRDGYTFNGWYIGNTKISNGDTVKITSNATATASWSAVTYTLTLNANGGSVNPTSISATYDGEYTGLPTPTRDGYTFNGWYINDTKINNGDTVKIITNSTATASWSAITYTIGYELNGGSYGSSHPTSGTYDSNVVINNPTKTGYTFTGWTLSGYDSTAKHGTSENAVTNTIASTSTLIKSTYFKNLRKTAGTVTLTANWSANTYTINYELNGGSYGTNHPTSATFDNVVIIDNPTREGYSFAGWTITSGLNTATAKHGTTNSTVTSPIENSSTKIMSKYFKNLTPSGSVTLSANWSSNTYTLTLNGNGVSVSPTSVSATYDSTYKDLPNLTRDGYTFNGWYIGNTKINNGDKVTITSNATATANWTAITYTINYVLNDGAYGTNHPTSGTYDTNVTISNPTREGYTFTGWTISGYDSTARHGNSSSEVTSTIASTSTLIKSTYFKNLRKTSGIVTLTANWQEVNLFKEHDWETIISNVQEAEKNGTSYPYKVGETKTISMDVGDGYGTQTHTLRVANTTPCDGTLESQTACGFVVEFADVLAIDMMNDTSTNAGGWKDSALRTYINETLYNALPTEIKNGIIDVTVISSYGNEGVTTNYTTTDKLYLLSGMEVFGSNLGYDTATAETRQLDYYEKVAKVTSENYTGAKKQYYGSNENWWLRSAHYMFPGWFYAIFADGAPVTNDASNTSGISPAFRIGTPSGAEKIINLFKTSATDNGLEANDPDTNVRYVGASPKNYIYFNCADTYNNKTYGSDEYNYKNACELWRIIGVFDQRIKIVKNDFLSPDMAYDSSGLHVNVWANSTLNAYLNGEYYNSLNSQSKLQINTEATWYVGSVSEGTAIQVYNDERNGALTIQDYVGLIYPSDFGYAGTNCGGYTIYDYDNDSSCGQLRNWLKPNSGLFWTMSPENGINPNVWRVSYQGWAAPYGVDNTSGIRPVVYLKTGIKLISGFGTTDEPYIIENIS